MTVQQAAPSARARTRTGTPAVDVQLGVVDQLRAVGVQRIERESRCTFEAPDEFFSYRRDGITGRHGVLVSLTGARVAE